MPAATGTAVRTVEGAIAFTDLSGFTEFCALRGDEATLELLQMYEGTLREGITDKGRIVKALGDGFMVWFGDPCAAIESLVVLQQRFEELTYEDFPLWIRIGIHFGRPIAHGDDLIGHDVNVAARIVDLAAPGEVLVSQACTDVMQHPPDGIEFEEVGPVVMKGIPEAITLFRAIRI
jgi:adenylate cyclase